MTTPATASLQISYNETARGVTLWLELPGGTRIPHELDDTEADALVTALGEAFACEETTLRTINPNASYAYRVSIGWSIPDQKVSFFFQKLEVLLPLELAAALLQSARRAVADRDAARSGIDDIRGTDPSDFA